jgi:hypothetical protein
MKTKKILLPALRQYCRNDGSEGFVAGFDYSTTQEIVSKLENDVAKSRGTLPFKGATFFDVQQHYDQSEEWECAMMYLDKKGIPRHDTNDAEFSLVGRITQYREL